MSIPLRHVPPVPRGFADRFVEDGWRGIEMYYGARTDLLLKWINLCGGEELYRRRRDYLRLRGMKPAASSVGGICGKGKPIGDWL